MKEPTPNTAYVVEADPKEKPRLQRLGLLRVNLTAFQLKEKRQWWRLLFERRR